MCNKLPIARAPELCHRIALMTGNSTAPKLPKFGPRLSHGCETGFGMQKKGKLARRRQADRRKRIPERTHEILRKMIRTRYAELCPADPGPNRVTPNGSGPSLPGTK